jgi:hypothetical protein
VDRGQAAIKLRMATGTVTGLKQMPETESQRPEASNQKAGARGSVNRGRAGLKQRPDASKQRPGTESASLDAESRQKNL